MSKRVSKMFCILFLLLELAVVPEAIQLMLTQHLSYLSPIRISVLTMTFGSIALCILMSFSAMSEQSNYPLHTFLFELMVFLCCIASVSDLATRALDTLGRPGLNMFVNSVYYLVGINMAYVIMLYEFLIIGVEKKPKLKKYLRLATFLMLLNNLATLLNVRFGFFFTINKNGAYQSATTFWISYIAPLLIVAMTVIIAAREMHPGRQQKAFLFFWVFSAVALVLQAWQQDLTLQYTGYPLSLVVIYLNIQSELDTVGVISSEQEEK